MAKKKQRGHFFPVTPHCQSLPHYFLKKIIFFQRKIFFSNEKNFFYSGSTRKKIVYGSPKKNTDQLKEKVLWRNEKKFPFLLGPKKNFFTRHLWIFFRNLKNNFFPKSENKFLSDIGKKKNFFSKIWKQNFLPRSGNKKWNFYSLNLFWVIFFKNRCGVTKKKMSPLKKHTNVFFEMTRIRSILWIKVKLSEVSEIYPQNIVGFVHGLETLIVKEVGPPQKKKKHVLEFGCCCNLWWRSVQLIIAIYSHYS